MKRKKTTNLKICGTTVLPGTHEIIDLTSTNLFTHTSVSVPVHVVRGSKSGPCLLVTAAIHGDELNGVEIIKKLIASKKLKKMRGTLIAVPIMNIFGFIHLSRYLPDRRDLNRAFPGNKVGSLASRLAKVMNQELVSKCTHLIDLHTGAKHRFNLPQIRTNLEDLACKQMAQAFAAPAAIHASERDGSLRSAGVSKKIPSLVYEAGEALRLDPVSIKVGLKGIFNVMAFLGMLDKTAIAKPGKTVLAYAMQWVRAPQSGIFYPKKELGQHVSANECIGHICDPFGQQETEVYSIKEGIIIGQLKLPLVTEGDALCNIAYFDEPQKAKRSIQSYDELVVYD